MEKVNLEGDMSASEKADEISSKKSYEKPELTCYGDVASVVRALGGTGADGNPIPTISLT